MKRIISVSLEKETIARISEILKKGKFRNKSHIVEEAVRRMQDDE